MPRYRHIVLFLLRPEASDAEAAEAHDLLELLGAHPTVAEWKVTPSIDVRKGRLLVQEATFDSAADYAAFTASALHTTVAQRLSQLADWLVGDYLLA